MFAAEAVLEGDRVSELPIQFSGDENHVHPRHTGRGRLDLVLALSAIFISAVSLYVAIDHGRTEQRLVAANSWPFLAVSYSGGPGRAIYEMNDSGIGPAKLQRFQVLYRGEVVPTFDALLERCCGLPVGSADREAKGYPRYYRSSISNTVFRPGQAIEVLSVPILDNDHGVSRRLNDALGEITFLGCYCSVFDECWSSNFQDLAPRRVRACEAGPSFNDRARVSGAR